MSKLKFLLVFILLLINNSLQAYSSNPEEFINELVNDAINKLADKNLDKDEKASFIEKIALDPKFNVNLFHVEQKGDISNVKR